jgi:hypothetical protein
MSVEVYSECRIQLSPTDRQNRGQNTSFDRCLVELRQYDIGEYVLRAIDLKNKKTVRIDYIHIDQMLFSLLNTIGNF